jgi:hypothetical protein
MARKRYGFSETRIQRFIREGRGQGTGKNYKPWLTVSDVPSLGRVHRVFCPKTGRVHHLLSDNEYYAFLTQWWDDNVIDIREQFPLINRQETLEIAARCRMRHPVDPVSGALLVMTTDFLITQRNGNHRETVAYAVKQEDELDKERTLEKLEIERCYWERYEVDWRILTEQQVKSTFTKNLAWLLNADDFQLKGSRHITLDTSAILYELTVGQQMQPQMPVRMLCRIVDQKLCLRPATTLAILRRLLGTKVVRVDLNARSIQDLPAKLFSIPEVRNDAD